MFIHPALAIIRNDYPEIQAKEDEGKGVKGSFKNRFFTGMFLPGMVLSLIALNGCAGLKQAQEDAGITIEGKKEMLVAEDIGRGHRVSSVFWCGSYAIAVYNEKIGLELIKIPTGERVKVSLKEHDYPFNCSPIGEWVVYMDGASTRRDKQDKSSPLCMMVSPSCSILSLTYGPYGKGMWRTYTATRYLRAKTSGSRLCAPTRLPGRSYLPTG